jgi:hypothetical protein
MGSKFPCRLRGSTAGTVDVVWVTVVVVEVEVDVMTSVVVAETVT